MCFSRESPLSNSAEAHLCSSDSNRTLNSRSLGTNWRTEILAGVTTFLTMAYIVLVNPAILADAGVPLRRRHRRHLPLRGLRLHS